MKIDDLKKLDEMFPEHTEFRFQGKCCDCNTSITITINKIPEGFEIKGGAIFHVPNTPLTDSEGERNYHLKCASCFAENPKFRNWSPCEVYSRVVGYLRPVGNWNNAKQKEFHQRKVFDSNLT